MFRNDARNNRIRDCFATLFGTDVLGYIILTSVIFTVLGLVLTVLFDTFIPANMRNVKYTTALDPLNYILSVIFLLTWKAAFEGYTAVPIMYRKLCFRTETLSDKFFTLHTNVAKDRPHLLMIKDALAGMIVYGYKMFSVNDTVRIGQEPKDWANGYVFRSHGMQVIRQKYQGNTSASTSMIRDMISIIIQCIKIAEKETHLSNGDVVMITTEITSIYSIMEEIDVAMNISEPPIFNTHNLFTLFIYFVVWQPFVMWITLDFWVTVIAYPIIMFLLTGVLVYRSWMGDPFDPERPLQLMNYHKWIKQYLERINKKYNEEMEVIDTGENGYGYVDEYADEYADENNGHTKHRHGNNNRNESLIDDYTGDPNDRSKRSDNLLYRIV